MSDSYGGLPSAPPPPPGQGYGYGPPQAARGPRPQTVTYAMYAMFAGVALNVIGVIVLFATKDDLKKRILKETPDASNSTIDAALTVGAVIGIVLLVLYALLAIQVGKGKNWARITTWVFAGIGLLGGLTGLGQPAPPASRAVSVIGMLLDLAIIVLLALGPSHPYFRKQQRY